MMDQKLKKSEVDVEMSENDSKGKIDLKRFFFILSSLLLHWKSKKSQKGAWSWDVVLIHLIPLSLNVLYPYSIECFGMNSW